jgi:hypothetical protein
MRLSGTMRTRGIRVERGVMVAAPSGVQNRQPGLPCGIEATWSNQLQLPGRRQFSIFAVDIEQL